jgi:hypothetical protein
MRHIYVNLWIYNLKSLSYPLYCFKHKKLIMKYIHFESSIRVSYPVGEYIIDALEWIEDLSKSFMYHIDKNDIDLKPTCIIWCRGSSGAILGSLLANALKKKFHTIKVAHIKKDGENSHSSKSYRSFTENNFNIVIDDFMHSGETLYKIIVDSGKEENSKFDLLILNGIRCAGLIESLKDDFKAFLTNYRL